MSEGLAPVDLLPLLFTTALMVYALALGSADLARSVLRVMALVTAAACLAAWGAAALSYETWGGPVIDDFYATAIVERQLGPEGAGLQLAALALLPLAFALREVWRLKTAR